jgi:osmoprotectant transport system substrate-binding protein
MKAPRLLILLLLIVLSAFVVAGCGEDEEEPASTATPAADESGGKIQRDEANAEVQLTIGSKNFTEQKVLGEIYAQGLEAAGFTVSKDLNLGDEKTALAALKSGEITAYPEYTGTALLSFFGKTADELPKDPQAAYEEARAGFEQEGLVALPPTPFTSSNEVAVSQTTADDLGLETISDLDGKSQDLVLYGSPECRQRLDCLLGLQQVYGLKFKKFVPVAIDQRHEVLTSGRADISIVFTTDPQIQRENEVLLEDDKGMFPPYNSTLVMKQETADAGGENLTKTVELIQEQLTDENMQELNARVDLDKKDPAQVAQEYLTETGLISGYPAAQVRALRASARVGALYSPPSATSRRRRSRAGSTPTRRPASSARTRAGRRTAC